MPNPMEEKLKYFVFCSIFRVKRVPLIIVWWDQACGSLNDSTSLLMHFMYHGWMVILTPSFSCCLKHRKNIQIAPLITRAIMRCINSSNDLQIKYVIYSGFRISIKSVSLRDKLDKPDQEECVTFDINLSRCRHC